MFGIDATIPINFRGRLRSRTIGLRRGPKLSLVVVAAEAYPVVPGSSTFSV